MTAPLVIGVRQSVRCKTKATAEAGARRGHGFPRDSVRIALQKRIAEDGKMTDSAGIGLSLWLRGSRCRHPSVVRTSKCSPRIVLKKRTSSHAGSGVSAMEPACGHGRGLSWTKGLAGG